MHMLSKLWTIGLLFTLPGMSQAHVQHAHGQSLLLTLLHPLTAIEHIVGLLLLGTIIYVVKRLQASPVQSSVFYLYWVYPSFPPAQRVPQPSWAWMLSASACWSSSNFPKLPLRKAKLELNCQ